jgi:hypothetical protein
MLDLPTTSYRDIAIHDNDLVVGTYGRGIWVLDDYAVLRQMTPATASEAVHLYKPDDAIRVRRNVNADTPFPPEVPHALNPPDGAIIYYSLGSRPAGDVTLDIVDASGAVVRHMSSTPPVPVPEAAKPPEPNFWLAPLEGLPTNAGLNRVNWDLRYDDPPAFRHSYEINANPGLTPASPQGALALPGTYTVRLTVGGTRYEQSVTVHNDPRATAALADLRAQHALTMKLQSGLRATWDGYEQVGALRDAVKSAAGASPSGDASAAVDAFVARLDSIGGNPRGGGGFRRGREAAPNFVGVSGELVNQLEAQDNADMAPTPAMLAAYKNACTDLESVAARWKTATTTDLSTVNAALTRTGRPSVPAPKSTLPMSGC